MSKKKLITIFLIASIIITFSLVIVNYYYNSVKEEIMMEEYLDDTTLTTISSKSTSISSKIKNKIKKIIKTSTTPRQEYVFVLEIPKINIKKGIYGKSNKSNNVDKNIAMLASSSMPDEKNGSVILASHNGNTRVSYFKNLERLSNGDQVYIYYKGNKYTYKIYKSEIVDKVGKININKKSNVSNICLISCKNGTKDKQIVYLGELINISPY